MGNFKLRVNSSDESKEAQELFFELGYRRGACSEGNYPADIIATMFSDYNKNPFSSRAIEINSEAYKDFKEITLPELRAMVNPMKEYLDANCNYEFVLSTEKEEGFIAIPEGAEIAIKFKDNPDEHGIVFYKNSGKSCMGKGDNNWQRDSEWTMDQLLNENYHDGGIDLSHDILWQRAPSLNDQYAEIEQVRQTLNERQSQYGSFKDVADTTAVFMDQFALGRMSNVQREALHMICSKLARIANGDPNHVDSWHDIAGYATLVVDDLES